MITKERLKELVEQGATTYYLSDDNVNVFDIDLSKIEIDKFFEDGFNYYIDSEFGYKGKLHIFCDYKNLYEFKNKEEAEWYLKFGNITRTETLSLPSWEELKQKINSNGYGNKTIVNFDNYIFEYKKTKTQIVLGINLGCETLFYGEFTLANYTDACELAKKLFLGEEEK